MAKLEIFDSKVAVQESKTPATSALTLPLSLATQQGQGIKAITKAVGEIQNDIIKIETQNAVDAAKPNIVKDILNVYEKASKLNDTDAALKLFYENTSPTNFEYLLENQKPLVKKLLRSEIQKERDGLVTKLFTKVTTEAANTFTVNLNDKFNGAIKKMLSSDQYEIGIGQIEFNSLSNNKFYEQYLGAKEYKKIVDDANKLKNNLLLELDTKINPRSVIAAEIEIADKLGTDVAKEYVEKARTTLRDNRLQEERKERFIELADANDKVGVFTNILLRIDNYAKNPTDETALNEMPSESELYDLYDQGLINEAMFVKLSDILSEPGRIDAQSTALSNDEVFKLVTEQFAAAKTIQQLDDVKKSYILDQEVLMNLALNDISTLNTLVDKAKSNFESHKDYKQYLGQIKDSIRNIDRVRSRDAQAVALAIATKENEIIKSYNRKVADGMKPELAYLDVLSEEMPKEFIPTLDTLVLPKRIPDIAKAIGDNPDKFFEDLENEILQNYRINQTATGAKRMIEDLDKINFFRDIFYIRNQIGGMDFALKEGGQIKNLEIKREDIQ